MARVVSGQTVEVLSGKRSQMAQVRLAGLTAPDLKQSPWGLQAKQVLEDWLLQQPVTLEISHTDTYGRQLAYVWLDDRMINEALLVEGYAMAYPDLGSKHTQVLTHAQHQARLLGRGIWNPEAPMRQTPVEFRQQSPALP
ncbi:MAG: thermonuclease family protein [Elainellaceae cyanobacterium]